MSVAVHGANSQPRRRHSGMVRKDQTSDAQLRIGESRDSGFDAEPIIGPRVARTRWHRPGITESGSLRSRNDVKSSFQTRVRDLAVRCARGLHGSFAPLEGVGNAGCPLHPRSRVPFVLVERTRATTSTPERPAFPHAMVLTAYVVLSPVTGLFCHRHQRIKVLSKPGWADATPRT